MANWTLRETCRACGSKENVPFWSAGEMYIVDFPEAMNTAPRGKAPIDVFRCKNCDLVQLRHTVEPDTLYRTFWYKSGTNEMMRAALKNIVDEVSKRVTFNWGDYVLDIGCNDGTMLESYPRKVVALGMDPAKNLQLEGHQSGGWYFISDFFSAEEALNFSAKKKYKVVTAIAMFYDLDEPGKFLDDVRKILTPDGIFVVQMNSLSQMILGNAVDNISHEHLCYYSLAAFCRLCANHDLQVMDVEENGVNGGSFRAYVSHRSNVVRKQTVDNLLLTELALLGEFNLNLFTHKAQQVVDKIDEILESMDARGKKIYAYGASTRGTVLMQLLKNSHLILGAAERDQRKIGRFMIGTDTPIISEEEARSKADVFLVLPYHFYDAIKEREKEWIKLGGQMLIPLPSPRIETTNWRATALEMKN